MHNLRILFQLYMDSEEGQRYMTFYKVNQWPYVAVLDPRTGELMVEWNYSETSVYETLITEFLATTSWGDEEKKVDDAPSEPKRRRVVIRILKHFCPSVSRSSFYCVIIMPDTFFLFEGNYT
jgi:hypothetical protein